MAAIPCITPPEKRAPERATLRLVETRLKMTSNIKSKPPVHNPGVREALVKIFGRYEEFLAPED